MSIHFLVTLYCKMLQAHGGSTESSGLGEAFDSLSNHMTSSHSKFLCRWDRLIDLEAKETEVNFQNLCSSFTLDICFQSTCQFKSLCFSFTSLPLLFQLLKKGVLQSHRLNSGGLSPKLMIHGCNEWQMGEMKNLNDKDDHPAIAFLGLAVTHCYTI